MATRPIGAESFLGRWRFVRILDDRRAGLRASVVGEAAFEPREGAPLSLDYAESGELSYAGRKIAASQRYLWLFPAPGKAEIHDRLGKPLCLIDLEDSEAWADHLCGEDRYRTRLMPDPLGWRQIWEVEGPRKDYVSETVFRRCGEA